MTFLTKRQYALYNKLCDTYYSGNIQRFTSLQNYIYSRYTLAIKKRRQSADLLAIHTYSQSDF